MSVSRGCAVVERHPNVWFCAVCSREHDYGFWDYTVYGPKKTQDEAVEEMLRNESNPGGFDYIPHAELTPYYEKLIDDGRKPPPRPRY